MVNKFFKREEGASNVMICLLISVIIGCAALVVDLGATYQNKIKLQNAVDNAVVEIGATLPTTSQSEIHIKAIESLELNGFEEDELVISYEYEYAAASAYISSVRLNAKREVPYGFAKIFGESEGYVTATAKITAAPIASTRKAISVYIEKNDFEEQLSSINAGNPFTITITSSGGVNSGTKMGIIRIVTDDDKNNYASFEGITNPRDPEFFEYGYYGMDDEGNKKGLSVGETRIIENNSSIYSNSYTGILNRITKCGNNCLDGCSYSSHSDMCARIALLPVVTVNASSSSSSGNKRPGSSSGGNSSSNANIEYFVAIYIEDICKSNSQTIITARYLKNYKETSDVDDSGNIEINEFTVCDIFMEE